MSEPAKIGRSAETGEPLFIGDIERRSGLYILGKPGMGKSALLVNLMSYDIENGYGLFFLDPHGDAITDLTDRLDVPRNVLESQCDHVLLLNPTHETHSFGINPLACRDITSLNEREDTYKRAYNIFSVLWEREEPFSPWLQLILAHTLYVFVENPEYTLAEVPMFLNPRNEAFRNHLLQNVTHHREVSDFWHHEFAAKRERDQEALVQAALTRVRTLLAPRYVRDIVGQKTTTINFAELMEMGAIILVNLPANLASDSKRFIGAILISELVHAVRNRAPENRDQFCIFVDEFQNFASDENFGTLITEARKFGVATTIAHQERYGQFANNPKLLGATSTAANKIFFQLTVRDAQELAPEFAENAPDTRTRLGGQLANSPHVIEDIWEKGHPDYSTMKIREYYFWIVDLLKQRTPGEVYLFDPQKITVLPTNNGNLHYHDFHDWFGYRATAEMLRRGISLLNKHCYDYMQNRRTKTPITDYELSLFLEIIDCFSGVFGWRQTMEAHIPQHMRERFVKKMQDKQDNEIMDMRRKMEQNMLPRMLMYHARTRGYAFNESKEGKELELQEIIKRRHPELLRKWIVHEVPNYYIRDWEIEGWTSLAREVFHPSEMEEFIIWEKRETHSEERRLLAEIVRLAADMPIDDGAQFEVSHKRIYQQYIAIMTYPFLVLNFGEKHKELPFETVEPVMRVVAERIAWQLTELQGFIIGCLRLFPWYLAQNPIQIQSAQYEEPPREKTQGEMVDIMGQELANLPRFTAYAKAIQEYQGEQIVIKQKIQTYSLGSLSKRHYAHEYSQPVRAIIEQNTIRSGYCIAREAIEEEIRERQENWLRRRGNELPPPTQTGGNTPPSLPSGRAGSDREPPPTHYIPEKTPNPPSRPTPSFKLLSLSFFESDKDFLQMGQRRYNTRFPLSTARFINYDIALHNLLYKQGDQTRQWEVRYYNPDGTLEGTNQDGNFVTPSDCKDFCHSGGRGREQPGHWKSGTYRVEILIDGVKFAEGSFTIE